MSSQSKLQVNEREGGGGGMLQPSTYLKPTSFPGPLPLPFNNGQGLGKEVDLKLRRYLWYKIFLA